MASRAPGVGVDIEKIESRTDGFVQLAFSAKELDFLPQNERDSWLTRGWCAKEAVGKARGTGLNFAPKSLEIEACSETRLQVNGMWVETEVSEDYGMAWIVEEAS